MRNRGVCEIPAKFDAEAFYSALDDARGRRGKTWRQVAVEAGISPSTLTRMAQGRRPDVDGLAALTAWSGLKSDDFIRRDGEEATPDTMGMISTYLRADPNLTRAQADAMQKVISSAWDLLDEK